ncbi:MAG: hypothetical protein K9J37_12745 [Saprospiraceae bacterium]|nr:hypothetical protein [Saprospiraceae bacterium]MCF8250776.1 hypothetical protein [Saprospiraceae bacterium]MCF8281754.1 hypothetical protein [Bacteroidales bacterium]MCF8312577.1 hypothetical protein [Saprospiraceae bacterium]MCF8440906.1 hypothetical protein [Saprospiraceae bacterium]
MKLLFRLIICLAILTTIHGNILGQNVRAVWMYKFEQWMNEPNFGNRVSKVSAIQFNLIYLGVDSEKLNIAGTYKDKIIAFVTLANSLGIDVHALTLQDPHFSLSYKHAAALARIQNILQYNISNPNAAFDGIHIDPEPHILIDWDHPIHPFWTTQQENEALNSAGSLEALALANPVMVNEIKTRRAEVMTQFVSLLQQIRAQKIDTYNATHDPDIIFSSTVGWWYNELRNGTTNGYLPTGATGLTAKLHVIVPMVYSGGIGQSAADIISKVKDEIQMAHAPTIIGISVEALTNFAGVQSAINLLTQGFVSDAAYQGISVFQFDFITGTPSIATGVYKDCEFLVGTGSIPNTNTVEFQSGEYITFRPGFVALSGSNFSASIQNCH